MKKPDKNPYKIKQGVNQWIVYTWSDRHNIWVASDIMSYWAANLAIKGE